MSNLATIELLKIRLGENPTSALEELQKYVLPCPACGGKAYYNPSDHSVRADGRVHCWDCFLEVEETHGSEAIGTALHKWNARVEPAGVVHVLVRHVQWEGSDILNVYRDPAEAKVEADRLTALAGPGELSYTVTPWKVL